MTPLDPQVESVLAAVFAHAQDAIGISHHNVIRLVNPSMVRLFGFTDASEMLGRSFLELLTVESRASIEEFVRRRTDGQGVPGLYHARATRPDGTTFPVEIRTTTFDQHGEKYALALLRDPSVERRSGAHELYEAIFARNTAVKLLIDPGDGAIVDANEAAAEFYGWPLTELRGMNIARINTLSAAEVAAELQQAREGQRRYFRFRHRIADGGIRNVDVHSGMIEVAGRKLLLSIVQDTTERDRFEEQLRQSQKLEAIGRLAGGVAHDFNNLLTVMMTCGDLLRRELPATGTARRQLEDLLHAADRARDLTRQLLAVGQRQHLQALPVDLDQVVTQAERLLGRAAGEGVTLAVDVEPRLTVEADAGQLEQVLMNLVLNARDATGGTGRVDVIARRHGDQVRLQVRDDGTGMDPATRDRVFDPFFTTKAASAGSGLGLASVYGIVSQSGGTVSVESQPGLGSTFTVLLPFRAPRPGDGAAAPARRRSPNGSVLLVDDETELREVLTECLEAAGFEVEARSSGTEALALTDGELAEVQVLVTDHVMPGPKGVEVARELVRRKPDLAVVLISGHLAAADRSRLPPGSVFLEKPFSGMALAALVRKVVRRSLGD